MSKDNDRDDPQPSPPQKTTEVKSEEEEKERPPSVGPSTSKDEDDDEVGEDAPRISQPSRFDVLFGRGKPYQGHAGNIRLHKIVDLYKPRYSQARRHEKTEIAEEIVQFIKSAGANNNNNKPGRFLKRMENEEAWVEVSDSIARDKVSHALRGKTRKEADPHHGGMVGRIHPSGIVLDDLHVFSAKRGLVGISSGQTPPLTSTTTTGGQIVKRQKLQPVSDLELLASRHHHPAFMGPATGASAGGHTHAAMVPRNLMQHRHQQQLFASAIAERQFAAGMASPYMGRMGLFAPHHSSSAVGAAFRHPMIPSALPGADMNPILLQQLAAERQLRADPRFWM